MGGTRPISIVAVALLIAGRSAPAAAQTSDGPAALPAHDRIGIAEPLALGWSVATSSSYGYTESVLAEDDAHHRLATTLAATYRPADWLAFGLRYDGRYDKHSNGPVVASDDGWIGQPTLLGRALVLRRPRLTVAAELGVWFPHDSGLGISGDGISADASAIATVRAADDLYVSAAAGFRGDRSANTADDAGRLSPSDRMALGVSDSNAALLGAGVSWRSGAAEVFGEWSWDLLVGGDAPRTRESPMRLSAGVRWSATPRVTVGGLLQGSLAARPDLASGDPLVPVDPLIRVVATAAFRFASDRGGPPAKLDVEATPRAEPTPPPERAAEVGSVRGRLVNSRGEPIAGVALKVRAGDRTVALVTNADGEFAAHELPVGEATVSAKQQPPYGAFETTVTVGDAGAEPVGIEVERVLPAGQIRGAVRTPGGKTLRARVRVESIGLSFETDAEGKFRFEVTPGTYEIEIEAPDRISQQKKVRVEQDGVTILNVELYPNRK